MSISPWSRHIGTAATAIALSLAGVMWADQKPAGCVPGQTRTYVTMHCIGVEWDVRGDSNHDATCSVQYRKAGAAAWRAALPLFRVDYAWYYGKRPPGEAKNMFAGSIMFLKPGTPYEVRLALADPDGGKADRLVAVRTRPIPEAPKGGRVLHVVPGQGRGTGARATPLQGVAAAEAVAKPGDTFLLHAGKYGTVKLGKSGQEGGRYIVWKSAGDGEAVFDSIDLSGSHVWIEGLTVKATPGDTGSGIVGQGPVVDAVICRSRVSGFHYCIRLTRACRDWYIGDNVLVGDKPLTPGVKDPKGISGEGVELGMSVGGHVVCYNSISRVADGLSYPGHDCDIYGNDIFDVTDDALEPDRGWANVRIWGNRLTNYYNAGISFQPMYCGPWYIVRNQLVGGQRRDTEVRSPQVFKFRVQDRFLLANNTIVTPKGLTPYSDCLFQSLSRNNLYISSTGKKPLWVAYRHEVDPKRGRHVVPIQRPDWRTDVDYDGFDWGEDTKTWKVPVFRYHWTSDVRKCYMVDLETFRRATGTERHAIRVRKEEIFGTWTVPTGVARVERSILTLRPECAAVDAGAPLANIVEEYAGKAPDLGAFESGMAPPHYGPRDAPTERQTCDDWVLSHQR